MNRILLYFGSFNPVHAGHLAIANYVMTLGIAERMQMVVSPVNPLKGVSGLASGVHRLEMVRRALRTYGMDGRIEACDIEFSMPVPSFTVDTLRRLRDDNPDTEYSILMGSDNLAGLARWKDYRSILAAHTIYVYARAGSENVDFPPEPGNIIRLPNVPMLEISSTLVRRLLAHGKEIPALLPYGTFEYIKKKKLYGIVSEQP